MTKDADAKTVIVTADPDVDPNAPVNKQGKKVILEAIYRMVGTDGAKTDKLYNAVTRARRIGLIAQIPLKKGTTRMASEDKDSFKVGMKEAGLQKFFNDPTVRVVVLGFADHPDDTEKNTALAQQRAASVRDVIRNDCDIRNASHPLPVRDWLLSDPAIRTRDYAVEVWVIVP